MNPTRERWGQNFYMLAVFVALWFGWVAIFVAHLVLPSRYWPGENAYRFITTPTRIFCDDGKSEHAGN
jgi:hypothetical protein